ncbi:hypothetical protein EC973_001003 [Apophysomyces ossiformis]|uniref:Uncharacterized protein n=1 Tax=Apophysomyces ossiformis TaxID=679940 RepID=A0A8H7EST4_9FUNG|nr:hypothetical protein EC973_001003 [Apophysomyces ossiformis]
MVDLAAEYFEVWTKYYKEEYIFLRHTIEDLHVEVVVCDSINFACLDAASKANIPSILTSAWSFSGDSAAPYINLDPFTDRDDTSLHQSFGARFYNNFISPLVTMIRFKQKLDILLQCKAEMGVKDGYNFLAKVGKDSLKLVNNFFGFEAPRPMGPLVELVGPIITRSDDTLSHLLRRFLDMRHNVAYVAFGQNFISTSADAKLILTALYENIEQGILDGFVWASPSKNLPIVVKTSSGNSYAIGEPQLLNTTSGGLFLEWAPQQAILHHPSVVVFVSHGGQSSMFESLSAGKRLVIFPFSSDQPVNALKAERNRWGASLSYQASQREAFEVIRKVAVDENGTMQQSIDRYKTMVQIHSKHGAIRGADLVEEVALTNINGKLPHRYEASREMSFLKAHNIDLYAVLSLSLIISAFFLWKALQTACCRISRHMMNTRKVKIT